MSNLINVVDCNSYKQYIKGILIENFCSDICNLILQYDSKTLESEESDHIRVDAVSYFSNDYSFHGNESPRGERKFYTVDDSGKCKFVLYNILC